MFAPKYRRQILYGKLKVEIGKILREVCQRGGCDDNRGRAVSESYTYATGDTTEVQGIGSGRISEREKPSVDTRTAGEFEV